TAIQSLQGQAVRPGNARRSARVAVAAAIVVAALGGAFVGQMWWRPAESRASATAALAQDPTPSSASAARPVGDPAPQGSTSEIADQHRRMLADLLALWTGRPISAATAAAWPTSASGGLDIAGVAARFELAATRLSPVSGEELRAIGLPALLLVPDRDRSG